MLVKLFNVHRKCDIYVNPDHVISIRPAEHMAPYSYTHLYGPMWKKFPIAGHTKVRYQSASTEQCDIVLGTLEEVAGKIIRTQEAKKP